MYLSHRSSEIGVVFVAAALEVARNRGHRIEVEATRPQRSQQSLRIEDSNWFEFYFLSSVTMGVFISAFRTILLQFPFRDRKSIFTISIIQ